MDLDLFAEAPETPEPSPDSLEFLKNELAKAEQILANPAIDSFEKAHAKAIKRSCEDRIALMSMKPSPHARPCNLNDYDRVREKAIKLFDGNAQDADDFLSVQLEKEDIDPKTLKGWNWDAYKALSDLIIDMATAAKNAKRRKNNKPKPEAEPRADKYVPSVHYQDVKAWALENGFTDGEVFALLGPIAYSAGVTAGTVTREVVEQLEQKLKLILQERKPLEELDLFGAVEIIEGAATDTETGEVLCPNDTPIAPSNTSPLTEDTQLAASPQSGTDSDAAVATSQLTPEQEQMLAEARAALGLDRQPMINSMKDVHKALRKRTQLLLEHAYLQEEYRETMAEITAKLAAWEKLYPAQLEAFHRANPPASGKTTKTLFGDLSLRDKPASVSISTEDEAIQQAWLRATFQKNPALAQAWEIAEKAPQYSRNLDKIKAWYEEGITNGKKPECPWLEYKGPVKNAFSVGPSFDTFQKNLKAGKTSIAHMEATLNE